MAMNRVTLSRACVQPLAALLLASCLPARVTTGSSTSISIPIEVSNNLPLARISVNGLEPAWFIVDTGAEASVIDTEWAEKLGLGTGEEVEVSAAGGTVDAYVVPGATLTLDGATPGGAELRDVTLVAVPLAGLAASLGRPLGGVLGSELFAQYVVEFDYAEGALRLHKPETYRYEGAGEVLPLLIEDDTPFVRTIIERADGQLTEAELLLDTGNSGVLALNTPFVNRHRLLESSGPVIPLLGAALLSGSAQRYVGRVGTLRLGSVRVPEALTMLAQDEAGDFAEGTNDGLIGGELLRRFARVVVDYAHRRVVLEPGAEISQPAEFDASGLSLIALGPDFRGLRVRLVLPGSPAEGAGIEPGDVLLTFDGRPVAEYDLDELRRVLRTPGERHTITLERGGSTMEAAITTRRLI